MRSATTVVVDLRRLTFMDCAALAVISAAARRARRSRSRLVVVPGTGQVDWLLDITGTGALLETAAGLPGEVEARRALRVA